MKLSVGDNVIIEQRKYGGNVCFEDKVVSVGSKYFYVGHLEKREYRFLKDSGVCEVFAGYGWARSSNYRVFNDIEAYRAHKALVDIATIISHRPVSSLSTEQILNVAKEYQEARPDETLQNAIEIVEAYVKNRLD